MTPLSGKNPDEKGAAVPANDGSGDTLRPCPARVEGPFLATDATVLRCGGLEGHAGTHYFHVEWGAGDLRWQPDAAGRHATFSTQDGNATGVTLVPVPPSSYLGPAMATPDNGNGDMCRVCMSSPHMFDCPIRIESLRAALAAFIDAAAGPIGRLKLDGHPESDPLYAAIREARKAYEGSTT